MKFPINLNTLLRYSLPDVRRPERYVAWRRFVADHTEGSWICNGNDMGKYLPTVEKTGIKTEFAFVVVLRQFNAWYHGAWRKEETSRQRAESGAAGGKKTAKKKRSRKKPL